MAEIDENPKEHQSGDLSSLIELSESTGELSESPAELPPLPLDEEAPLSGLDLSQLETEAPEPAPEPAIAPEPDPIPEPGVDSIKKYSEDLAAASVAQGSLSFPFTLKIEGQLAPGDSEKLLSILTRENMGFREVDLEPQIAEGKILIPRISEYVGILLIQALRGVSARISFGPADEIFSTPETRDEPFTERGFAADREAPEPEITRGAAEGAAGALMIPVTHADALPQFTKVNVLDTVVASGLLSTRALEAASSKEHEILLEALIRELKFKAHRRGANGILALAIQLTPLTLPTDYRVTVTGTAVLGAIQWSP